jgi:mRNA interferase YafQ
MPLRLVLEKSFSRSWKKLAKKRYDYSKLQTAVMLLASGSRLPGHYGDHALAGNLQGLRECHIEDNWLLIYRVENNDLILIHTGTHDDCFK